MYNYLPNTVSADRIGRFSETGYIAFDYSSRTVEASVASASNATVRLFGVFPVKDVSVVSDEEPIVTVCGYPFGCLLDTQNILVVDMSDIVVDGKSVNPARDAGIRVGDAICSINGSAVMSIDDVASAVEQSNGGMLSLTCMRNGAKFNCKLKPVFSSSEKKYKLGIWVRDSEAGVGIMSFYSPEYGVCAGLGHALKDSDTGDSFLMKSGDAYNARIMSIKKGSSGNPGQIMGCIQSNKRIGEVLSNSAMGMYIASEPCDGVEMKVASRFSVSEGAAQLYLTLDGEKPQYYDVIIERVNLDSKDNKNLVIKVVDDKLLAQTGGIVQGMSGSPIIQNGKLVGAVTHVLVDDPTRGYGVFAENMLETARSVEQAQNLK